MTVQGNEGQTPDPNAATQPPPQAPANGGYGPDQLRNDIAGLPDKISEAVREVFTSERAAAQAAAQAAATPPAGGTGTPPPATPPAQSQGDKGGMFGGKSFAEWWTGK